MLDSYRLETVDQLRAISKPVRWRMLVLLIENPMTGSQLARALDIPRNTAHYHLHILKKAALINFEEERLNSGLIEHYYRAIAHIFLSDHFFTKEETISDDSKAHKQKQIRQSYLLGVTEQVKMDLLQASDADIVNRGNFYYAYAINLTYEQTKLIESELGLVEEHLLEFRKQNESLDPDRLVSIRYTVLKTPAPFSGGKNKK